MFHLHSFYSFSFGQSICTSVSAINKYIKCIVYSSFLCTLYSNCFYLFNNCLATKLKKNLNEMQSLFELPLPVKLGHVHINKARSSSSSCWLQLPGCIICQVQFDWHKIYSMQFDTELLAATLAASGNSGAGSNTTLDILI